MKRITLFFFLFWSLPNFGEGIIHVLYGDLKSGQQQILNRVFRPKLKELLEFPIISSIKENHNASHADLTKALRSPSTLGVIFLGHPAIKTKGKVPNKEIIHGYLQDAEGRYLPKKILSAAHENLAFLSIMTCHESAILPLYLSSLPENTHYYKSPTHSLNSLGNPLFEFTSFYSTPKILMDIKSDLEKGKFSSFFTKKVKPNKKIKITAKDLVSQKFGHSLMVNGKYIGAMFSKKNKRGRLLNLVDFEFEVPNSLLNGRERTLIEIIPDDADRPKPAGLKVVDDILIEKVSFEGIDLLTDSVHIGDQKNNPDFSEGLGFLRNQADFEMSPYFKEWRMEF